MMRLVCDIPKHIGGFKMKKALYLITAVIMIASVLCSCGGSANAYKAYKSAVSEWDKSSQTDFTVSTGVYFGDKTGGTFKYSYGADKNAIYYALEDTNGNIISTEYCDGSKRYIFADDVRYYVPCTFAGMNVPTVEKLIPELSKSDLKGAKLKSDGYTAKLKTVPADMVNLFNKLAYCSDKSVINEKFKSVTLYFKVDTKGALSSVSIYAVADDSNSKNLAYINFSVILGKARVGDKTAPSDLEDYISSDEMKKLIDDTEKLRNDSGNSSDYGSGSATIINKYGKNGAAVINKSVNGQLDSLKSNINNTVSKNDRNNGQTSSGATNSQTPAESKPSVSRPAESIPSTSIPSTSRPTSSTSSNSHISSGSSSSSSHSSSTVSDSDIGSTTSIGGIEQDILD